LRGRQSGTPCESWIVCLKPFLPSEKGLTLLHRCLSSFSGDHFLRAPLWYRLANAFSDVGRLQEAIEAFQKASEIDPLVTDIWNDLGVTYTKLNDYKGAFTAFKKAVSVDAKNTNSLKNLGIVYAICGVDEGVQHVHRMLSDLDSGVAKDFIADARRVLSER
jgi:tetratricopeptide (TPR) repeat protein